MALTTSNDRHASRRPEPIVQASGVQAPETGGRGLPAVGRGLGGSVALMQAGDATIPSASPQVSVVTVRAGPAREIAAVRPLRGEGEQEAVSGQQVAARLETFN